MFDRRTVRYEMQGPQRLRQILQKGVHLHQWHVQTIGRQMRVQPRMVWAQVPFAVFAGDLRLRMQREMFVDEIEIFR